MEVTPPELHTSLEEDSATAAAALNYVEEGQSTTLEGNPYEEEIKRLRAHLLQLDEDINKATEERDYSMNLLQEELRMRDDQIAALQVKLREATMQQADAAIDHDLTEQLRVDNEKLRQVVTDLTAEVREKNETLNNLQSAVNMLQNSKTILNW